MIVLLMTQKKLLESNDERIKYYKLKTNSGAAVARTTAMQMLAKGSYMAFLDSDDIWTEDKLGKAT